MNVNNICMAYVCASELFVPVEVHCSLVETEDWTSADELSLQGCTVSSNSSRVSHLNLFLINLFLLIQLENSHF